MKKGRSIFCLFSIFLLCLLIYSCPVFFRTPRVKSIDKETLQKSKAIEIKSPTKVHLYDGSLIVFENGFQLENNVIKGDGERYNLFR
ncbi:MAG: hypothetical protein JSV96_02270, partial [Candidatus Aminicenantes bacterium]